jgi:RimJ/RimL family protein N-acetyltransferase
MSNPVALRDVELDDLPILFEHQQDPEAGRMAAFPARDWNAFEAHWKRLLGDATIIKKTIVFDGQVAGNIVCFDQADEKLVGYWIGRRFWGKGIATRALRVLLTDVAHRPLHAHVAKRNAGSIRVLEKCGFVRTGENVVSDVEDGDVIEEYVFTLTR